MEYLLGIAWNSYVAVLKLVQQYQLRITSWCWVDVIRRNSGSIRGFEIAGNPGKLSKHFLGKRKSEQSRVRGKDRPDVKAG